MKDDNKLREEAELFFFEKFIKFIEKKTTIKLDVPQLLIDFHKSQMESDAVEFAEWIDEGFLKLVDGKWHGIKEYTGKPLTTKELYQLFLKSKTDKTE